MYESMLPLYTQHGGKAVAFMCCTCGRPVKTKRSMWRHLKNIHGIVRAPKLKFEEPQAETANVQN